MHPWQLPLGVLCFVSCIAIGTGTVGSERLKKQLAEIEAAAKELFELGQLDGAAVSMLDEALEAVEQHIRVLDESQGNELYFMSSILRGTIYQQGSGLSDHQIEKMENAYTFSNSKFWDRYYEKTQGSSKRFDWYGTWDTEIVASMPAGASTLADIMQPYLQAESRILMLGCGRSDLSEKMYRAGFENIVNVDISDHLLDSLRAQLGKEMPQMSWVKMNASSLDIASASFDVVIDKGTLDSLQENSPLLQAAVREAHRALRRGGVLLSVTDAPPELRLAEHLQRFAHWGRCRSHSGRLRADQVKVLHVHACPRITDDLWTRFKSFWQSVLSSSEL